MRKMKDSGIEWIGDIPEGWEVTTLKNLVICLDGQRIPIDSAQRISGEYPYWGAGNIVDYVDGYIFDEELVLLGEDGAPFFDPYRPVAFYVTGKIWVNNHIHVLRPNSINAKFLTYILNSVDFRCYINGTILSKLTQSNMNKISLCYPSLDRQQRIADYLDARCARIDESMELVRQSMEKLRAYKLSLITEAVTKGLDPDVPMKDSGIPWIGEIPEGWEVRRLKNISLLSPTIDYHHLTHEDEVTFLPMDCIKNGFFINKTRFFTKELSQYSVFENDNILLAKVTPCFENGNIAIAKQLKNNIGFGTSEIFVIKIVYGVVKFLSYVFQCNIFKQRAISTMTGTGGLKRVSPQFMKDEKIVFPPLSEQQRIADYLDAKCARIDAVLEEKERLLDRLAGYKKSLIFECVTGKREVSA